MGKKKKILRDVTYERTMDLEIKAYHTKLSSSTIAYPPDRHVDGLRQRGHGRRVPRDEPLGEGELRPEDVAAAAVLKEAGGVELHRPVPRLEVQGGHLGARVPDGDGVVVGGVDALGLGGERTSL